MGWSKNVSVAGPGDDELELYFRKYLPPPLRETDPKTGDLVETPQPWELHAEVVDGGCIAEMIIDTTTGDVTLKGRRLAPGNELPAAVPAVGSVVGSVNNGMAPAVFLKAVHDAGLAALGYTNN